MTSKTPRPRKKELCLALLCLALPHSSSLAADKIEFSNKPAKIDLPAARSTDSSKSGPFDFLRPTNPGGGSVEPLAIPSVNKGNVSKRLSEYLDQKKNWMFVDPKKSGNSTLNDLFKVENETSSTRDGKPKKAVEQFLQGSEQSTGEGTNSVSNTNTNDARLSEEDKDLANREDRKRSSKSDNPDGSPDATFTATKTEFNEFRDSKTKNPYLDGLPDTRSDVSLTSSFSDSSVKMGIGGTENSLRARQAARDQRLGQLYQAPGSPAPLNDPINSRLDSTSSPANPVQPLPINSITGRPDTSAKPAFGSIQSPLPSFNSSGRAASLEDIATRNLNPLAPTPAAISQSVQPTYAQPKPAILDFPRRRF